MKDLLEALRAEVRAVVIEELAKAGAIADAYSSTSLPRGITSRTFARWCRSGRVRGAVHDGAGWRCSASAWREARAGEVKPQRPTLTVVPGDDADSLLRAAGLRPTRTR